MYISIFELLPTCLCIVLNKINTVSKDSKLTDLHIKKMEEIVKLIDHQVFQLD